MKFENLLVEYSANSARVTINRESVRNALNHATLEELERAIEQLGDDPDMRTIVLTGAGDKSFVAGADIKAMVEMEPELAQLFAALGHRVGDVIAQVPKIVIAAVNGYALGGGCELALACDFAYASDRATFAQPEVNLGIIPGFGGTTRLPRRIGLPRAIEMVTTGATLNAQEAYRLGLVNKVVPHAELLSSVKEVTDAIAQKGPAAIAAAKRSLRAAYEVPLEDHNKFEIELFGNLFTTSDQEEGMRAFLEKRPAKFTGL